MTENGWPPDTQAAPFVSIPLSECVQVVIPGTTEKLWFQKGLPAKVLPAFFADLNAYVESSNNSAGYGDEGSWTNGNSVGTSNHLGATAFDYNWTDHPMGNALAGWGGSEIIDGPEEPEIRRILKFYTYKGIQLVWWGNDWDEPKDSMHFQMGYGTFEHQDIIQEFCDKFIRPDGFSTYRRGNVDTPDDSQTQASVLAAAAGIPIDRAIQILPTMLEGLRLAECNNHYRIAMFIAQTRHESDQYRTTVEYGQGAGKPYYPYYGRGWIQCTWESNYRKFGIWASNNGYINDSNLFVDNPDALADVKWAGIVSAWFWTAEHDGHNMINDDCDNGDVDAVTYTINGGSNGLGARTAYYNQALSQGDALLTLIEAEGDSSMAGVNVDGLNLMIDKFLAVWGSRGMFVTSGDGVDDGVGMLLNTDGNSWNVMVILGALLGVTEDVKVVKDTASGKFPENSFVAGNSWLKARAQEFAQKLLPLCGSLGTALTPPASSDGQTAKKTTPKKTTPPPKKRTR